ncbi:MAG: oligosaccharide flippase family protein [Candidatus Micrarchaeota archaeon]|nr:oligosaccharide flippase family protein [Candidatus Micrarchaeota archaeon]
MAKDSSNARVARHGIVYVAGQIVGSVAVFITLVILARQLHPADLGLYAIAIAFFTLLGIFSTFSMGTSMRKKLAEDRGREGRTKLVSSAYLIALSFSLVVALIGIACSSFVAVQVYHQPQITGALMLASVLAIFWALFNITIAVLVGIGRVTESAIVDVVYSVIQLIAAPLLVAMGYGVMGAVAGLGIGLVIGTVVGVLYIIKDLEIDRKAVDTDAMKEIVGFSVPVFISTLALQGAYNLGILLLGTFASASVVANYYNAYKLGSLFVIIINSMTFVLLPAFSAVASKARRAQRMGPLFNRTVYFSALILAPAVAFVAALSRPLIFLFFSRAYLLAPPYLAVMSFGIVLGMIWNYANVLFLGIGDTKSVVKYQLGAAAVQVALLAILTPMFGIIGMLASLFVISPLIINVIYARVIREKLSVRMDLSKTYRVAIAAIALFVVLYGIAAAMNFRYLSVIVDLVVALLLYPPLVTLIGGIGNKDLKSLREVFGSRQLSVPLIKVLDYAALFARR